jgi:predicted DNA-binding transcriptional regulator AlpA
MASRNASAPPPRHYLTGPQVCARYSITEMSLWRWLNDRAIAFPQPALRVRDRRYWLESDLLAWERAQLPPSSHADKHEPSKRAKAIASAP